MSGKWVVDASEFFAQATRVQRRLSGRESRQLVRRVGRENVLPEVRQSTPVVTGALRGAFIVRNAAPGAVPKGVAAAEVTTDGKTVYMVRNAKGVRKRKTARGIDAMRARQKEQARTRKRQEKLLARSSADDYDSLARSSARLDDRIEFLEKQLRTTIKKEPHKYAKRVNRSKKSRDFFTNAIARQEAAFNAALERGIGELLQ